MYRWPGEEHRPHFAASFILTAGLPGKPTEYTVNCSHVIILTCVLGTGHMGQK